VALYAGDEGTDIQILVRALKDQAVCLSPFVLAELFSDPQLHSQDAMDLRQLPLLGISDGFWERAGGLRAELFRRGHSPKLVDTMIAQSCIDHRVPLLTRDRDFRPFAKHGDLILLS
jgi:predicted nucleic acid-binding protein